MKLLTKENRKNLPRLYSQENQGNEAIIHVKFFTPWSNWTWYATEGQPVLNDEGQEVDFEFFGLVDGFEKELCYFILSELESVIGYAGLKIERDRHFAPQPVKNFM